MNYEWLKIMGALSFLGAWFLTWRTHSERATFEMIDRLYSLCHTLQGHLLREWRLSHLFCIGEKDYLDMKGKVSEGLEAKERAEFLAKEQMFAIHVFVIYEQVLYQWAHSSKWFHRRRRAFLQEMLSYFTDRLLLNPRLQWFLDNRDATSLHLEKASVDFLNSVRKSPLAKKRSRIKIPAIRECLYEVPHPDPDKDGPFQENGQVAQITVSNKMVESLH